MKKAIQLFMVLGLLVSLAVPAAAAFTPSVEQKGAPVIKEVLDQNGQKVGALVYDQESGEVGGIPADSIRVTAFADHKEADKKVMEEMAEAYTSIEEAKELTAAMPALETTMEAALEKMKENKIQVDEKMTASDLVVRDVFNIGLDKDAKKILKDGASAAFTFEMDAKKDDFVVVMRYVDIKELQKAAKDDPAMEELLKLYLDEDGKPLKEGMVWLPVDPELVEINEDGTVTVRLNTIGDDIGTIAFVTRKVGDGR